MTDETAAERALAVAFREQLDHSGGFTLDGRTHQPMIRGVSVGVDPSVSLRLNRAAWDDDVVAGWVAPARPPAPA